VASANVDLASDESMEEVPIEVTRSGGILINDIDMEHNDESNEDEGKDEEVGLVAAVPVVQSERDSDSKSHEQQGKPAVAHKDRTRGDTSSVEQGRALQQKRWLICLVMSFVVIIIAVVVPCALLLPKNNNTTESDQLDTNVPYATVSPEQEELFTIVTKALDNVGVNTQYFLFEKGYQYKSFHWLSGNANLAGMIESQRLQRFALATLYFSTNNVPNDFADDPGPWTDESLWLTDESECDWAHVRCDADNKTQRLIFQMNNLSGKLPPDLALLQDTLEMLDLTSNLLHMVGSDFDVFDTLLSLKYLDLDDNFIESRGGLPQNFKNMQSLEEFKASYNLMSGPLDNGVLETLQKLTHLEIESNFFTGALPFLGVMTELTYVYLRHNNLSSHLNFLKGGRLTNLFSFWLDGNDITRTIPTQIGELTSLASLSIVNASLTGTIPTEFGVLPLLTRVWLNGNDLVGTVPEALANITKLEILEIQDNEITGTMPEGICEIIQNSEYEYKSLVADCDEVECTDCCTKCA
jgi:hypothetical protein